VRHERARKGVCDFSSTGVKTTVVGFGDNVPKRKNADAGHLSTTVHGGQLRKEERASVLRVRKGQRNPQGICRCGQNPLTFFLGQRATAFECRPIPKNHLTRGDF
jgi:hypothetical protein